MWKSACVGVYQLLNWKMHGETLKNEKWFLGSNLRINNLKKIYDWISALSCIMSLKMWII